MTESIGLLEQLPADPEEGLTAVQPGQGVIIALVLDAAALGHRRLVVVGAQGHDGFRQLVQLPDAGAGKFRHGLPLFLCVHQLFRELCNGLCQTIADEEGAGQTDAQCQQYGKAQQLRHRLGEAEQIVPAHHADEQPPLTREGGVAAVQADLPDAGDLLLPVHHVIPAVVAALERQFPFRILQRYALLAGVGGDMKSQHLAPQVGGGGGQQIAAVMVVLQLVPREFGVHVTFQKLNAQNAVDCAVVQDKGLRVGDGLAVVAPQLIRQSRPAAIVCRPHTLVVFVGSLEGTDIKHILLSVQILQCRRPRLVRSDVKGLHQLRRSALKQNIRVYHRGGCIRVEVAQVNAGQAVSGGAAREVVGIQDEEDARNALGAQRLKHPGGCSLQQRQAVAAAGIQRLEGKRFVVQHLLGGLIDVGRKIRQFLCLLELVLNVACTVLHLLVQDVHRVLIQLEGNAADRSGRSHQHDHDGQHDHQRREDGNENRMLSSLRFIPHQQFHALPLLPLVFVRCLSPRTGSVRHRGSGTMPQNTHPSGIPPRPLPHSRLLRGALPP